MSEPQIILAIYPNRRGFGYACVQVPQKLLDFGVVSVVPVDNETAVRKVQLFIEFYRPKLVLVRDYSSEAHGRGKRIVALVEKIVEDAAKKQIRIHKYTRQQIKEVFEILGVQSKNKYDIAQKLISIFSALTPYAPKIRKPWMDEDYKMGIFDAIALAITHESLKE